MRTHIVIVLSMSGFLLASHSATPSGQEGEQTPQFAVIDIDRVLKEHVRLQQCLEKLRKETGLHKEQAQELKTRIEALQEELSSPRIDSLRYAELQEQITNMRAELAELIDSWNKQRTRREARLYDAAYAEIRSRVEKFAVRYEIQLVINYDSDEIDSDDPDEIVKAINRRVVFQRSVDITNYIIDR